LSESSSTYRASEQGNGAPLPQPEKTKSSGIGGVRILMQDLTQTLVSTLWGIGPIVIFLLIFNRLILKSPIENPVKVAVGLIMATVGLFIFVLGLKMGLLPLGENVGRNLPAQANIWLIMVFGFLVGYGVTLAEPALQSLGLQVEELSAGIIKSYLVVHTVAFGVGIGVLLGLLKILFHIPFVKIIIPTYILVLILSLFSPPTITGVAFDSGGVTTGPVTVPIIMALGVGLATALGGRDPLIDGFGIIALSSAGPIISVMLLGIIYKF
jgi:hypothetical protein